MNISIGLQRLALGSSNHEMYNSIPNHSIGEIPIIKILNASYSESDYDLGFGKTEYDYLLQ